MKLKFKPEAQGANCATAFNIKALENTQGAILFDVTRHKKDGGRPTFVPCNLTIKQADDIRAELVIQIKKARAMPDTFRSAAEIELSLTSGSYPTAAMRRAVTLNRTKKEARDNVDLLAEAIFKAREVLHVAEVKADVAAENAIAEMNEGGVT